MLVEKVALNFTLMLHEESNLSGVKFSILAANQSWIATGHIDGDLRMLKHCVRELSSVLLSVPLVAAILQCSASI
jgi:hypothetical protein